MNFIPYGRQAIDDGDIAAVVASLRSDFLTCGPEVEAFEREFSAVVGANRAAIRRDSSSGLTSSTWLAMVQPCPNGSTMNASRSP